MARTEARLDATGAVTRRRSAGPPRNRGWEPVEPRTDWARVERRSNAEPLSMTPKRQKMRRLGCGGFAGVPDCHRPSLPAGSACLNATVRGWEQGKLAPQGAARALLRVLDRVPEAVLALSAS